MSPANPMRSLMLNGYFSLGVSMIRDKGKGFRWENSLNYTFFEYYAREIDPLNDRSGFGPEGRNRLKAMNLKTGYRFFISEKYYCRSGAILDLATFENLISYDKQSGIGLYFGFGRNFYL